MADAPGCPCDPAPPERCRCDPPVRGRKLSLPVEPCGSSADLVFCQSCGGLVEVAEFHPSLRHIEAEAARLRGAREPD